MSDKASVVSYATSSAVGVAGALTLNQWLAIAGFGLAAATFAVNLYYKRREDKRKEEYHRHLMTKSD